jgi:hypothetical protein
MTIDLSSLRSMKTGGFHGQCQYNAGGGPAGSVRACGGTVGTSARGGGGARVWLRVLVIGGVNGLPCASAISRG